MLENIGKVNFARYGSFKMKAMDKYWMDIYSKCV